VSVTVAKTSAQPREPEGIDIQQFGEEFERHWAEARKRLAEKSAAEGD
jgi:hypothetical protein